MRLFAAKYLLFIMCLCCFTLVNAQSGGYQKDSLQIKVYSVIHYKDSKVESIKITKTFCDYCSENQLNALKQEAWNRAYYERYSPKNRLVNGKKKLALYIRISKKDFLNLKEVEDDTTN